MAAFPPGDDHYVRLEEAADAYFPRCDDGGVGVDGSRHPSNRSSSQFITELTRRTHTNAHIHT